MQHFIEQITGKGQVLLEHDRTPETDGWAEALVSVDQLARQNAPGDAPVFNPAAALWGAEIMYQACRCAAFRSLNEQDVAVAFSSPCPEAVDASTVYSVDLTLRFLPDLFRFARGLAENDPLISHLVTLAQAWPLSSVGVEKLSDFSVGVILADSCLRQLYVDRILNARDRSRIEDPRVADEVKRCLGAHPDLFPDAQVWFKRQEDAKDDK